MTSATAQWKRLKDKPPGQSWPIFVGMAVAAISPHAAWKEPILHVIDNAVRFAVSIAAVSINLSFIRLRRSSLEAESPR